MGDIQTQNEYAVHTGQNMENHTASLAGKSKYVKVGSLVSPTFRTRQEIYRFVSWLLVMAPTLPDEEGEHDFDNVLEAIESL